MKKELEEVLSKYVEDDSWEKSSDLYWISGGGDGYTIKVEIEATGYRLCTYRNRSITYENENSIQERNVRLVKTKKGLVGYIKKYGLWALKDDHLDNELNRRLRINKVNQLK